MRDPFDSPANGIGCPTSTTIGAKRVNRGALGDARSRTGRDAGVVSAVAATGVEVVGVPADRLALAIDLAEIADADHAPAEIAVRRANAGVDDVNRDAGAGLRVAVPAVQRKLPLIEAVESPQSGVRGLRTARSGNGPQSEHCRQNGRTQFLTHCRDG